MTAVHRLFCTWFPCAEIHCLTSSHYLHPLPTPLSSRVPAGASAATAPSSASTAQTSAEIAATRAPPSAPLTPASRGTPSAGTARGACRTTSGATEWRSAQVRCSLPWVVVHCGDGCRSRVSEWIRSGQVVAIWEGPFTLLLLLLLLFLAVELRGRWGYRVLLAFWRWPWRPTSSPRCVSFGRDVDDALVTCFSPSPPSLPSPQTALNRTPSACHHCSDTDCGVPNCPFCPVTGATTDRSPSNPLITLLSVPLAPSQTEVTRIPFSVTSLTALPAADSPAPRAATACPTTATSAPSSASTPPSPTAPTARTSSSSTAASGRLTRNARLAAIREWALARLPLHRSPLLPRSTWKQPFTG